MLRARGIRLASAAGVNAEAVAEHAMALILALERHLHTGRDNQAAKHWRGMISEIAAREDELTGKTLLIVGLGRIGARLAKLAKAFDMRVIATKRDPGRGAEGADAVYGHERLPELLGQADIVALTCPLTPADREPDRRQGARRHEAVGASHQRGARQVVDEDGADHGAAGEAHRRRRPRRHARGAAAGRLAAVGHAQRADHAAHRRRDAALRGRA